MKPRSRLAHEHEGQDQAASRLREETSASVEFASPEDAVRQDREATEVPARLAERIENSVRQAPAPAAPWWRRLFHRS